jgi:hypothetical protein
MKKNVLFLLFTIMISANELKWVDQQVDAIKPSRVGISNESIRLLKDPFVFLDKNNPKTELEKLLNRDKKVIKKKRVQPVTVVSKPKKDINTSTKPTVYMLNAIMNESALINGKWYKNNDIINGYRVIVKNESNVLLSKKSKKILLSTKSTKNNINFKIN